MWLGVSFCSPGQNQGRSAKVLGAPTHAPSAPLPPVLIIQRAPPASCLPGFAFYCLVSFSPALQNAAMPVTRDEQDRSAREWTTPGSRGCWWWSQGCRCSVVSNSLWPNGVCQASLAFTISRSLWKTGKPGVKLGVILSPLAPSKSHNLKVYVLHWFLEFPQWDIAQVTFSGSWIDKASFFVPLPSFCSIIPSISQKSYLYLDPSVYIPGRTQT